MADQSEQTQAIVTPIPRRMVHALVALFATQVVLTMVAMLFAYAANASSDRQWCGVLRALQPAPTASPPATQAGRDFQAQMRQLYVEFDCADEGK